MIHMALGNGCFGQLNTPSKHPQNRRYPGVREETDLGIACAFVHSGAHWQRILSQITFSFDCPS